MRYRRRRSVSRARPMRGRSRRRSSSRRRRSSVRPIKIGYRM